MRADFAQLLERERRTSAATARDSTDAAHRAYAAAVVGVIASIALLALYAAYLTRAIVRPIRRAATLTGRLAGGDLAARLPRDRRGRDTARWSAPSTSWAPRWSAVVTTWPRSPMSRPDCGEWQHWSHGRVAGRRPCRRRIARSGNCFRPTTRSSAAMTPTAPAFTTVGNWSRDGDSAGLPYDAGRRRTERHCPRLADQTPGPDRSRRDRLRACRSVPSRTRRPIDGRRPHQRRRAPVGHRDRRVHPRRTDAGRHGEPARQLHRARLDRHRERRGASGADRITRAHRRHRRRDQAPFRARSARRRTATVRRGRAAGARRAGSGAVRSPRARRRARSCCDEVDSCAIDELRDFAQGIHPAILAEGGLDTALRTLARRSSCAGRSGPADERPPAREGRGRRVLRGVRGAHERRPSTGTRRA